MNDEDESEPQVKVVKKPSSLKSKRWIITLTCLSFVLLAALVICFIKYRTCCVSSSGGGSSTSNSDGSSSFFLCSKTSALISPDYDDSRPDDPNAVTRLSSSTGWNSSRLPAHLAPWHYEINLRINVHARTFTGRCAIRFQCLMPISFLVVHADVGLQFPTFASYKPRIFELRMGGEALGNELRIKQWTFNAFFSYYVIELDNSLYFRKSRHYLITFENYQSVITNNLKGIYYSTYVTKNQTR
jgi:hypothetical protein